MYLVTYIYKVPKSKIKDYIKLQKTVKAIYMKAGCLAYEVYKKEGKENIWMEINKFKDKKHFEKARKKVDQNPEIDRLFKKFCSMINIKKNPVVMEKYKQRL